MEKYIEQAASIDNIYLAYLRLKNMVQNTELLLEQEILYFEKVLIKDFFCIFIYFLNKLLILYLH